MSHIDVLLNNERLHMDQLMFDQRVRKLVSHVADHAYLQGHIRGEHKLGGCKDCEKLLLELFPQQQ